MKTLALQNLIRACRANGCTPSEVEYHVATRTAKAARYRAERRDRTVFLREIESGERTAFFCSRRETRWLANRGRKALF